MEAPNRCSRCDGRMFELVAPDEACCIYCGHTIYATAPLPWIEDRDAKTARGRDKKIKQEVAA